MPTTRRSPRPAPGIVLFLLMFCALLALWPALPCQAADPGRKDNAFGTTREGLDMGRDPATGDVFMRVSPPPPPQQQQQPILIQPEIRPEVTLPTSKPKPEP